MSSANFLTTANASRIAYRRLDAADGRDSGADGPGIIFLIGHGSDMEGTKALACEDWARRNGRACLRFDYSGHGLSSGDFLDGNISNWTADCLAVLDTLTTGPQILVGSSLGGWLMYNVALARPDRVAGLIGIAAAPDFTEDLLWAAFTDDQRRQIEAEGMIALPNPYSDEQVIYPWHLITNGRHNLRLRGGLDITCPVHLLHGMQDTEVPWQTATTTATALLSDDVEVTLVKEAGHRFSEPDEIARLFAALDRMTAKTG